MTNDTPKNPQKTLSQLWNDKATIPGWWMWFFALACYGVGGMVGRLMPGAWQTPAIFAAVGLGVTLLGGRKKTKELKDAEAAVSPVIGVILMVAITVVLAAVVFLLVKNLAAGAPMEAPNVVMASDDHGASYYVLRADLDLAWSDFTMPGCSTLPSGPLDAGDTATGCAGTVRLIHTPTNTVVWTNG